MTWRALAKPDNGFEFKDFPCGTRRQCGNCARSDKRQPAQPTRTSGLGRKRPKRFGHCRVRYEGRGGHPSGDRRPFPMIHDPENAAIGKALRHRGGGAVALMDPRRHGPARLSFRDPPACESDGGSPTENELARARRPRGGPPRGGAVAPLA
jgi:hypothetical protein